MLFREDGKIMFRAYCLKSYERPLKPYREFIEASSEEEARKELLKKIYCSSNY